MNTKLFALAVVVVVCRYSTAQETNFYDGTFAATDWAVTQVAGFGGAVSAAQVTSGGNPGDYWLVNNLNFTNWIYAFHFRRGAIYSPYNIPNSLIDFSIDQIAITNLFEIGIGVQIALEQNGTNYFGPGDVNSQFKWQTFSVHNLQATNFSNFVFVNTSLDGIGGSAHPDFSAGANSIQFGFATWNDNIDLLASRAAGFDNWSIAVHQAPLLTNMVFLGNGQLQMQLLTTIGHTDTLQVSANLLNWNTILVTNASTNVLVLVDPNPASGALERFYRVVDF